ncbi:MAG: hypothetical protein O2894_09535 [Planctomycetota bacterium]|nr:hypothetical protein [Planctomycetota bacterium]
MTTHPDKVFLDAELIADTRTSEEQLGFRNVGARERRMLFQAGDAYVELLVPGEGGTEDGGWLYGQLITPTPECAARFRGARHASLIGSKGCTGAARLTDVGDFAVPFWEPGDFELHIEPAEGPIVRMAFSH